MYVCMYVLGDIRDNNCKFAHLEEINLFFRGTHDCVKTTTMLSKSSLSLSLSLSLSVTSYLYSQCVSLYYSFKSTITDFSI